MLVWLVIVCVLLLYDSLGDFGVVEELAFLKENHRMKTSILVFPALIFYYITYYLIKRRSNEK